MHHIHTLWSWPNGLVWKWTRGITIRSRQKKFDLFMRFFSPTAKTRILDVGVSGEVQTGRAENFLEDWYKFPEMITAISPEDLSAFHKRFPKVVIKQTDGKNLPFANQEFDIVFSNAVIEHVGDRTAQEKFVAECLRVGKSVFLTTPAREFPIESHTMIPFVHWLPESIRNSMYNKLGRKNEAKLNALTLLTAGSFRNLFPKNVSVKIFKQRMFGFTSVLIAVVQSKK